jgi:two-component system, LuxR family, response regulator FixJ
MRGARATIGRSGGRPAKSRTEQVTRLTVAVAGPDEGRVDAQHAATLALRSIVTVFEGRRSQMSTPRGRVVCIVDDDASLRRSLRNLLMSVGFPVETFESAEAFLESAHQDTIGCLVLDVRMAGISGLDLLSQLVASGSRTPIIVLTAHADAETRRRALAAGAAAFLEKPVRSADLLDAIRTALASAC